MDLAKLAASLAEKAIRSKRCRATACHGLVIVIDRGVTRAKVEA